MLSRQFDLFAPPAIERAASIAVDAVFFHAGRALRVHRVHGNDNAAPVIVEELAPIGRALKGQFSLWSADAVRRCLIGRRP